MKRIDELKELFAKLKDEESPYDSEKLAFQFYYLLVASLIEFDGRLDAIEQTKSESD